MRLVENSNGLMIVEHWVGYSFVFKIDSVAEPEINLVDQHWEGSGPAPDACHFEQEARRFAKASTRPVLQG